MPGVAICEATASCRPQSPTTGEVRWRSSTAGTPRGLRFACGGVVPTRKIVDQAVQDTFVAVWRKPQSYKGQGEVAAWIWGIGVRRLIDQSRRQPKRRLSSTEEELRVSAEDEVLIGIEHGDLPRAINQLSPKLASSCRRRCLDGLTTL